MGRLRPAALCILIAICSQSVLISGRDVLQVSTADAVLPDAKCFSEGTVQVDGATCIPLPARSPFQNESFTIEASTWPTCGLSTVIPAEKLGSCPDAQAALDAHNAARIRYGANPLLWSKTLADYAQGVSLTCVFQHSNGNYGENLAIGSSINCKRAVDLWVAEEAQWPPGGTPGFSSQTGHFSQVVWKDTLQVGCAIKSCSRGNFVTCSYNPPGNYIGKFETQVGANSSTPECYPTTSPGPTPSPSPTPISSPPPRSSPRPPTSPAPRPPSPSPSPVPPPPPARRCCWWTFCYPC